MNQTITKLLSFMPLLNMRRAGLMAVGIFWALAMTFTGFTGTAGASAHCNSQGAAACFYVNANFGGTAYVTHDWSLWSCHNFPAWFNDVTSSASNRNAARLVMYKHANCTGSTYSIPLDSDEDNLAWTGLNDSITSWRFEP